MSILAGSVSWSRGERMVMLNIPVMNQTSAVSFAIAVNGLDCYLTSASVAVFLRRKMMGGEGLKGSLYPMGTGQLSPQVPASKRQNLSDDLFIPPCSLVRLLFRISAFHCCSTQNRVLREKRKKCRRVCRDHHMRHHHQHTHRAASLAGTHHDCLLKRSLAIRSFQEFSLLRDQCALNDCKSRFQNVEDASQGGGYNNGGASDNGRRAPTIGGKWLQKALGTAPQNR